MASIRQIVGVLIASGVLIALLGAWIHYTSTPAEVLLESNESLPAPLSPNEIKVMNNDKTNSENRVAVMTTSQGVIEIELFEDVMPITTGNFVKLAQEGFYNGTKFHRVIEGFMIQAGDPNSRGDNTATYGTGGPGYTIADEFVEGELLTNIRGTIAMANTSQPNSGGSQFFINLKDNSYLDFNKQPFTSRHPVFGRVVNGMDVVDSISHVAVGGNDIPEESVVIETIEIK